MMNPKVLSERAKGVAFMTMTPFDKDGNVDYEAYRENVRFMMDKTKGFNTCTVTPCGSNGEFAFLSEEEHKNVIKICVEEVNGQMPVIAGTGQAGTKMTIKMSKYAQDVGVDGLQVILPYYFVPTEEGMFNHYKKLSENVDVGIVVYNNPGFAGSWVKPALMRKMVNELDGKIAAVKENSPHLMLIQAMVKALEGTGVPVLSGYGEQWYAYVYQWGVEGMATPFGNIFPEYPMEFFKAAKAGDLAKMKSLLDMMTPYYAFIGKCTAARPDTGIIGKPGGSIYGEGNVRFSVLKTAMNLMGLRGGYLGSPLIELTDKEKDELKEILRSLKLM